MGQFFLLTTIPWLGCVKINFNNSATLIWNNVWQFFKWKQDWKMDFSPRSRVEYQQLDLIQFDSVGFNMIQLDSIVL